MKKAYDFNNVCKKISLIITITFVLVLFVVPEVYATQDGGVAGTLRKIASYLLWIGAAVCIGKLVHIGIMYIMSSAEGKSSAKSAFLPWLIGAILLSSFAAIGGGIIKIFMETELGGNVLDL